MRAAEREPERRMQPGAAGSLRSWEVRVVRRVGDQVGSLSREPGPAFPRRQGQLLGERLELGRSLAWCQLHAVQPFVVASQLPHRADLPAERSADRLERRGVDLDRGVCFGEDRETSCSTRCSRSRQQS